jgi:predicted SAM-dependent methyltransferase
MILVDYSRFVCDWLPKYLKGKGSCSVYYIDRPSLPMVASNSVDVVLANGVFEHIEMDDLFCFLEEFYRILKGGGVCSFNFDNIMAQESVPWFKKFRGEPGAKCEFRFYHPDVLRKLAIEVGLRVIQLTTSSSRFGHVDMQKPHVLSSSGQAPIAGVGQ